jgi:hypothetical protein
VSVGHPAGKLQETIQISVREADTHPGLRSDMARARGDSIEGTYLFHLHCRTSRSAHTPLKNGLFGNECLTAKPSHIFW